MLVVGKGLFFPFPALRYLADAAVDVVGKLLNAVMKNAAPYLFARA